MWGRVNEAETPIKPGPCDRLRPGQAAAPPVTRPPAWAVLGCCLAAAVLAPVSAAQVQLPPLVEPASQEHHTGKVILLELVTPDIAAAERFYGGLFGWTFRDSQDGAIKYAAASLGGHTSPDWCNATSRRVSIASRRG